jgi:hypothetical protein
LLPQKKKFQIKEKIKCKQPPPPPPPFKIGDEVIFVGSNKTQQEKTGTVLTPPEISAGL